MEITDTQLNDYVHRGASVAIKAYKFMLEDDRIFAIDVHVKGPFGGVTIHVVR